MNKPLLTSSLLVASIALATSACYKEKQLADDAEIEVAVSDDGRCISTSVRSNTDRPVDITVGMGFLNADDVRIDFREVQYEAVQPDQEAEYAPIEVNIDYACLEAYVSVVSTGSNRNVDPVEIPVSGAYGCD